MGSSKQMWIEEMESQRLSCCVCYENTNLGSDCIRCGEPVALCGSCKEQDQSAVCEYCSHVAGKDD